MNFLPLFSRLMFPPRCIVCRKLNGPLASADHAILCPDCTALYEKSLRTECAFCALPLYDCTCVPALLKKAGISEYVKVAPYGADAKYRAPRRMVLYMKDHNRREVFAFVARELMPGVRESLDRSDERFTAGGRALPETAVTFVPRNRSTVRRVGFDQSGAMAKALSRELDLPFLRLLTRKGHTKEQKKQNAKEREKNLRHAFRARGKAGLRVLLVDDVVTTGASMAAAARELYHAGVAEVIAVSFAFTLKII